MERVLALCMRTTSRTKGNGSVVHDLVLPYNENAGWIARGEGAGELVPLTPDAPRRLVSRLVECRRSFAGYMRLAVLVDTL